ncbi:MULTISPECIES: AAA family ATPase [Stenotrophomonas]|jgi:RecA-family ATPase|uniref:AAA family ATPase n=1 Tax=Stenotrophomonas TaxID=40323 RepID=UPI0015DED9AC|nr:MULTISPECIES: AAA family ATPase [Stenotrophomonas]MDH0549604.1 AAA family ATPase [Stenotrophomonas sp. GD04006]
MNHINAPSIGQGVSGGSENLPAAQNGAQAAQHPSQYPSGGNAANAAPAPAQSPAWVREREQSQPLTPEAVQAQAETARANAVLEIQREATKAEETRLEQEKVRLKRDLLKKGLGIEESPGSPRALVGRTLGTVQMRAIDWLWIGWIPKGYVTLLAGETGAGKSTVLADVTARVTTGAPWPGEYQQREPSRVLWLGSEDSIEEMTAPRLVACGGNLNNVVEIQGVTQQGKRNTFSMQDDLDEIRRWLAYARDVEYRPFAMLVIDPVTSYLPGQKLRKVDLNDAGQLRTVLEPWLVLAQEHNIAIVCVTHFAKDTTRSMLHRVLGSAAFAQTCRSLMAIVSREDDGPHAKAMMQVKVNLPEHPGGSWKFSTVKVEVGTDPRNGKPISATRPDWEELDSALTPQSMVGNARGPVSQYEAAFGMWVKAYFLTTPASPWQPIPQVKQAALSARVVTERWWNEHSSKYLNKQNVGGTWYCQPKNLYAETT